MVLRDTMVKSSNSNEPLFPPSSVLSGTVVTIRTFWFIIKGLNFTQTVYVYEYQNKQ